jgi:hypothetical protein
LPSTVRCDYMGRDQTQCASVWCGQHIADLGSGHYCRRHARIQAGLHEGVIPPVVDNRAPSVVLWMVEDLTPELQLQIGKSADLTSLPLNELTLEGGQNGWEAGWLIASGTVQHPVTVFVADDAPTNVNLRLNEELVHVGVPPWIEQRTPGLFADWDKELRQMFRQRMLSTVMLALQIVASG